MLKKLLLLALLLCSLPVAAQLMFPALKSCESAGSDCVLRLDSNFFLVDVASGKRLSETAESAGAMSGFWLYRDGDRYILENENYSQAKSRRWLVFTYNNGRVVLDGAYIFSIDMAETGPYWHGYDCRGNSSPFTNPGSEPFSDAALEELCGGAEGWVVSGKDSVVPVSAKGLAVSVPVYHARNRDGSATYLFTESDVPDLSKLVCLSNCADVAQTPERVSQETAPLKGGQDGTLCSDDEDIYFSCPLDGGKTVSVCARGNSKPTAGSVQYRYGVPGKVEMIYPKSALPPKGKFFVVNASEGSVSLNIIKFKTGPYTYLVNQAFVSYLTVLKDDKLVFRQRCGAGSYSYINRAALQGLQSRPKSAEDFR